MSPLLLLLLLLLPELAAPLSFNYTRFDHGVSLPGSGNCTEGSGILCLEEDASLSADSSAVILAPDRRGYRFGWAYHSDPLHLADNSSGEILLASFTTQFSFNLTPTPVNANVSLLGDGMAFFLFPHPFHARYYSEGGFLGLLSNASKFEDRTLDHRFAAVELDTVQNVPWDNAVPHVGIDVNSLTSVAYKVMNQTRSSQLLGTARADYSSIAKRLNVSVVYNDGSRADISATVDLAAVLPASVVVGFSAATGSLVGHNQVTSWSFRSTLDGHVAVPGAAGPSPPSPAGTFPAPSDVGGKKTSSTALLVGIPVAVVSGIAITVGAWLIHRRRRAGAATLRSEMDEAFARKGAGPRPFPFRDLAEATGNFADRSRLGAGASGTVYRGFLRGLDRHVAIKRVRSKDSRQTQKEYMAEVIAISQLRHRHLVQLLGWCHENAGDFLLVYELMPNLSLDKHLFGSAPPIPWPVRYKVALQVASALLYLHEYWTKCVVHRDIKCSNILLDDAFDAKLGDFGVARQTTHGAALQSTMMCGTLGYMAPECYRTGKASKESDVYAFGIVALEVATGRMVMEPSARDGELGLVERVWRQFEKGELAAAADTRLEGQFEAREMEKLLLVGLWCAHRDPLRRPTVRRALAALNLEDVRIDLPPTCPWPCDTSSDSTLSVELPTQTNRR